MSNVKRVYIATWGNPLGWREGSYQCGDEDLCGSGKCDVRRSYSSIVCMNNADIYVIYVLDSVITASTKPQDLKAVECARKYSLCANNECSKLAPPSTVDDLSKWRELVRGYIECIVKELLGDARNVKVVVTSVKGRLGDWEFTGKSNPDLIASELLIELWRYIKDLITDDVDLHLFLDVTHGINFMPTLTYQITRYIATLALIKGAGNTYIRVYNALPGSSEDSFEVVKLINDSIKRLVLPQDTRSTIVKALTYGGALATIPKILSKEHVCDKNCDKDYDNFQVNAKINHGGDKKVEYEFKGGIKPNDVYSRLIEKLLCEDKVFSQAVEKGGAVRLSDLMRHRLIGKLSDVAEVIIRDELNDMYKVIDKAVKLGIKVYGNYYSDIMALMHHEGFHDQCACRGGDEDKRNFIAHAGLLKNCTRIISYNNEYCIMIDDEALKCLQ